jgi:hypothetical protein
MKARRCGRSSCFELRLYSSFSHASDECHDEQTISWMDQAGDLYKQWADQQQALFRSMSLGMRSARNRWAHSPQTRLPVRVRACARRRPFGNPAWNSGSPSPSKRNPVGPSPLNLLKTLFDPSQWAQAGLGPLNDPPSSTGRGSQLCDAMDARPQDPQGAEAARGVGEGPRRVPDSDARRVERGRQALLQENQ